MASDMADVLEELFGISFRSLTTEERGELAESMLSAGRASERLRQAAGSQHMVVVTGWPFPPGTEGVTVVNEREAREGIADDCIQVFNALEALKRHAHAAAG